MLLSDGSVCLSSSADFEDHEMEAYFDRMVLEFRVILDRKSTITVQPVQHTDGTAHFASLSPVEQYYGR